MGCYNETCMLSHLQIISGDYVKLIILVKNSNDCHGCYHNEMYAPLTLPVYGKYDDYGGIKTENVPSYTCELLSKLKFMDNHYEKYKFTTIDALVEKIISRDGLYLRDDASSKKLECVFVHDELYDILVDDFGKRVPYRQTKTIRDLWTEKHKKIKELVLKYENITSEELQEIYHKFDLESMIEYMMFKTAQYGYQFPIKYVTTESVHADNIDYFIKEMVDYIMFAMSLESGRYGYLSKCGSGGQDLDVRVQKLIAKFVLYFSERLTSDLESNLYTENETIFWNE